MIFWQTDSNPSTTFQDKYTILKHVPTAPPEDTSVAADAGATVGAVVDGGVGPSTLFQKIFSYFYKRIF
jgi:hypothetical protein